MSEWRGADANSRRHLPELIVAQTLGGLPVSGSIFRLLNSAVDDRETSLALSILSGRGFGARLVAQGVKLKIRRDRGEKERSKIKKPRRIVIFNPPVPAGLLS
jgi:hypothetical protein